jgi:hypothetical protein
MTGEVGELLLHMWYILIICFFCKFVIERIIKKQGFFVYIVKDFLNTASVALF